MAHIKTWYEKIPGVVTENVYCKILCDVMIQCDFLVRNRKPNIAVVNKKERTCMIIDIA